MSNPDTSLHPTTEHAHAAARELDRIYGSSAPYRFHMEPAEIAERLPPGRRPDALAIIRLTDERLEFFQHPDGTLEVEGDTADGTERHVIEVERRRPGSRLEVYAGDTLVFYEEPEEHTAEPEAEAEPERASIRRMAGILKPQPGAEPTPGPEEISRLEIAAAAARMEWATSVGMAIGASAVATAAMSALEGAEEISDAAQALAYLAAATAADEADRRAQADWRELQAAQATLLDAYRRRIRALRE